MKFVASALVLALFLNDANAVKINCPDGDASKLKAVLKALGDAPAPAQACPCGGAASGGCSKCGGGGSADGAAKKAAAKATKAVKKMEEKVIEKAE